MNVDFNFTFFFLFKTHFRAGFSFASSFKSLLFQSALKKEEKTFTEMFQKSAPHILRRLLLPVSTKGRRLD